MKSLDILCPAFREEEVIGLFHRRLAVVADGLADHYRVRIRYLLDPSADGTEQVLAGLAAADPRVEVLVMSRRFGHQAALIAGMDASRADAVVMLDTDLQHPPELIPELVRCWEKGADVVQTIRQDGVEIGLAKRLTSRWFYQALLRVGSVELKTGAADYRLLSARVVEVFRRQLREHNPFLRGLVSWVGFTVSYVPFVPAQRAQGRSKYRLSTLVNFALNGICSFSKLPLRFCIGAGVAIALLAIASALVQLVIYFCSDVTVPGWASLFAVVSFIGGIQLFFLGVLGEYVGLIFDEVKARPRYLVDRRYGGERSPMPAEAAAVETSVSSSDRMSPLP